MASSNGKVNKKRKLSLKNCVEDNVTDNVPNLVENIDLEFQNSNSKLAWNDAQSKANSTKNSSRKKTAENSSPEVMTKKFSRIKMGNEKFKDASTRSKVPESSAESKSNRTIEDWIKNPVRERSVRCPVCDAKVLHSLINNHLDSCFKDEGIKVLEQNSENNILKNENVIQIESNIDTKTHSSDVKLLDVNRKKVTINKKSSEILIDCRGNSKRRKNNPSSTSNSSNTSTNIKSKKICAITCDTNMNDFNINIESKNTGVFNNLNTSNYLNQSSNKTTMSKSVDSTGGMSLEELKGENNRSDIFSLATSSADQSKTIMQSMDSGSRVSLDNVEFIKNKTLQKSMSANMFSESMDVESEASFNNVEPSKCNILTRQSTSKCENVFSESMDVESEASFNGVEPNKCNISTSKCEIASESMDAASETSFDDAQDNQSDPYYLANFKLVLDTVLSNEEDKSLFNEEDVAVIEKFQAFPIECQKLYIRLFQRRPGWFRCSKIDYPKIAKDLKPVLNDLLKAGFLESEKCLTDLRETLRLLSAGDLKDLGKAFHIIHSKTPQHKGQTKNDIIDALIKHGGTQRTLFGNASAVILKRAKAVLGPCVRVSSRPKFVFLRVLLLFTMNIMPEDDENKHNGQANQLSTIFLANIGKLLYPDYKILREVTIFADRDAMITFANAYQDKHDMAIALEGTGELELAYSYYPKAKECYRMVLEALEATEKPFSAKLPIHLRCFSAEWVYTKMCYLGVEVLQKMKRYDEAVEQLKLLLQQDIYCADCRGKWWDRLALNVHQHLKQPCKALEISKAGLQDSYVRFGRRLALIQRVKKIVLSGAFKKKKDTEYDCKIDEGLLEEPTPPETITIQGKRSEQLAVFISHEVTKNGDVKEDTMTFLSVEEYALSHYRQQGYDEGIHGETSTFTTLYGLFFWDIIFVPGMPDVFRALYQTAPLDLNYDTFYERRKTLIDKRLDEINTFSTEKLQDMVESNWNENHGIICSGVSWERFTSLEQAKQFVSCVGGKVLSGIFNHFARDMRHWHSGMPDLVVWNSANLQYRIVEVKGPGDRLSTKQQLWLSELASFGATVEVCYVTAIGGKRFRASTNN